MPTLGLTLGKYAPLHQGHQLVIETALAEMNDVIVLVYDAPETTPVPLTIRAQWVRDLYPAARVIEVWDGPTATGDDPAIQAAHNDYLLKRLQLRGITHFYSSEAYGAPTARALNAVDRRVDMARAQVPIAATTIRHNPYAHRAFLDPRVYRDLIQNVVFLGAPSTGKTTLAEALAREFNTVWMPEYGREYWEQHQVERRLTLAQLVEIAEGHLAREDHWLTKANGVLFTDTNALTTCVFSRYYHGAAHPRLAELAQRAAARYDLVCLCETDIPYDDTWDRSGDANRVAFQNQIVADLLQRKIPFFRIAGDLPARIAAVKRLLMRYPKYRNFFD
jgi:NadR type nicotinamide-nucleotide adenylyltransferase